MKSPIVNLHLNSLIENLKFSGSFIAPKTDLAVPEEMKETINDDGIMYIRTDCLKIANGDLEKAQQYFEWIIKPLKIVP